MEVLPIVIVRRSGWSEVETVPRSRGPFQVSPGGALHALAEEVTRNRGRNARLSIDVSERDLTRDNQLRADAAPVHPGVVLTFTHPVQGELKYARDLYLSWHHNVRAIELTLNALRGIDRWGGKSQQFGGFKALPSSVALGMGQSAARKILEDAAGLRLVENWTRAELQVLIDRARGRSHPDARGGDRTLWNDVENAARVLEAVAG